MRLNDALLGCILLLVAAVVAAIAWGFPAVPGQDYGASTFPLLIATGLAGCGAVLIGSGLRERAPIVEWQAWLGEPRRVIDFLSVITAIIVWILAWRPLGFILTTAGVLFALLRRFGVSWKTSLAIAIATPLIMNYIFGRLLLVPLPAGLLAPIRWW
ncbi:putative tricarboxylic transport membrane protein [Amaricoccus macauensis]|uniref:Putative tricarboxylic transport membrane protein n=1 Tax=Amaricoccus macauensis TaxID=57001 RepID=A0A840SK63_9RHOB|nr:tripartite tricarboxylate transporter TctB family protein [Amaricoccus macauensis]MBB5220276.1 putative tricarboxylic transport membrane protein [Amaricoccus macauensis]